MISIEMSHFFPVRTFLVWFNRQYKYIELKKHCVSPIPLLSLSLRNLSAALGDLSHGAIGPAQHVILLTLFFMVGLFAMSQCDNRECPCGQMLLAHNSV